MSTKYMALCQLWEDEKNNLVAHYMFKKSRDRKQIALVTRIGAIAESTKHHILTLYFQKCKIVFNIAFFRWHKAYADYSQDRLSKYRFLLEQINLTEGEIIDAEKDAELQVEAIEIERRNFMSKRFDSLMNVNDIN